MSAQEILGIVTTIMVFAAALALIGWIFVILLKDRL